VGRCPGPASGEPCRCCQPDCAGLHRAVSVFGPILSPHDFDTVYRDYVKVPASLEAYPRRPDRAGFLSAACRARLNLESYERDGDQVVAKSPPAASHRSAINVRYIDRSDLFKNAALTDLADDDKSRR
jgi:oligopeptide transport system permease protein